MNPNVNEQPDLHLPQPSVQEVSKSFQVQPEVGMATSPEIAAAPPMVSPLAVSSIPPHNVTAAGQIPTSAPTSQNSTSTMSPLIANDTDLIEKDWVNGAKRIVESTKEDPHAQTNEISRYRASYVKKRFNKDLKVADR